jgi:endonuclease G
VYGSAFPKIEAERLGVRTTPLCFSEMAILYSGLSRGPLWAAEHLTGVALDSAQTLPRPPSTVFHAESAIAAEDRSELSDYKRSGFDRGHMAPNGDMSTPQAQAESFSLANMVPQHPCNNEVLWEGVEDAVRQLARANGEVFVVTGPAFLSDNLQSLKGRVLVPTHVYKAVYIPSRNRAGVYFSINDGSQSWQPISVEKLTSLIGIDVFPALAPAVKAQAMDLPEPMPHRGCRLRTSDATAAP